MSRLPTTPLDREEADLAARYAKLPDALPSTEIDQRIRDAATAALRRRPRFPWPTAIAAALALGIGVKIAMEPAPLPGMAERTTSEISPAAEAPPAPAGGHQATTAAAEADAAEATAGRDAPGAGASMKAAPADLTDADVGARRQEDAASTQSMQRAQRVAPASLRQPAVEPAPSIAPAAPAPAAAPTPPVIKAAEPAEPPPPAAMSAPVIAPQAFPASPPAPRAPPAVPRETEAARDALRLRRIEAAPEPDLPEQRRAAPTPRDAATATEAASPEPARAPVTAAKSLRAAGEGAGADSASDFDALVAEARERLAAGDVAGLRDVLARIAREFPGRALPDDLADWRALHPDPA